MSALTALLAATGAACDKSSRGTGGRGGGAGRVAGTGGGSGGTSDGSGGTGDGLGGTGGGGDGSGGVAGAGGGVSGGTTGASGGAGGSNGGAVGTGGNGSGGVGGRAGAGTGGVAGAGGAVTAARKLDLIFLIDDSVSMKPLQAKLVRRLPDFINVLKALPGGLPDLHLGVISSSMGAAGTFPPAGCGPTFPQNADGAFQAMARPLSGMTCPLPVNGDQYIVVGPTGNNLGGADLNDVFSCITPLGDGGCGFEQHFQSLRRALERSKKPRTDDTVNGGFLRSDASLGIVILANEDDCSVPQDSILFDTMQMSVANPLGGLQSYRCAEFGHLCNGAPPPHQPPTTPVTLDPGPSRQYCESNEQPSDPRVGLTPLRDYVRFIKELKTDPSSVFVSVIGGPPTPYAVDSDNFQMGAGLTERQPKLVHSCVVTGAILEYGDPSPRLAQFVEAFGGNGLFVSICEEDFKPALTRIAQELGQMMRR